MKYIYSTSQISKLSLTLCTFSATGSVAGLFLTVPVFQYISGLCLINQSYPKNMSIPFKSVTTVSICSLYLLISTFSSTNHVTFPFLILSTLKILNDLFIGFVLIFFSFTSCLLILVWIYSESTSTYNHSSFLFAILIFVHTFNLLS